MHDWKDISKEEMRPFNFYYWGIIDKPTIQSYFNKKKSLLKTIVFYKTIIEYSEVIAFFKIIWFYQQTMQNQWVDAVVQRLIQICTCLKNYLMSS